MQIPVSAQNVLLLVSETAGLALLVSVVWLLYKRRIYLDAVTKKPIQVELPVFGKLTTQSPVIFLVMVAAALVLYPIHLAQTDRATVEGYVETTGKPVTVTVVLVPAFQETIQTSGPFKLQVPIIPDVHYRAWFSVDRHIQNDQPFDVDGGKNAKLVPVHFDDPGDGDGVVPVKEVSDEKLRSLNIIR